MLESADRDLIECKSPSLGDDWRLAIAHNCTLLAATAALAAAGYRATREAYHYRVLQSLAWTVGVEPETLAKLHILRKKRNQSSYQRAGATTSAEAEDAVLMATTLLERVKEWLCLHYPDLMANDDDH